MDFWDVTLQAMRPFYISSKKRWRLIVVRKSGIIIISATTSFKIHIYSED
jgi:hypothetical protein